MLVGAEDTQPWPFCCPFNLIKQEIDGKIERYGITEGSRIANFRE
jgi:hypothetical protein